MAKFFKIIGTIIGAVLLLLVAASVILPLVVDPNDFKGEIVNQVKEQTGRDLKIAGDLNLSVFPWLGVKIEGVELSNAKGFGDGPFALVRHAAVRVKLKPLLKKELEVDTIGLDGVMLNLARNKSGASNWDDLAQGKQHKSAPDKKQKQDTVDSNAGLKGISIGGVDITDATINWDDRQSGQKYAISEFNLKSGAIVPGSPVGLNLGMVLQSAKPALKAKVGLVGTIELDQGKGLLNIGDLKFTVDADGAAIPNGKLQAELETALMLALDGTTLTLQNLKAKSGALSLTGNIKGSNLGTDSPVFNGQLKLAELNLREWMASQGMALPATSDPKSLGRLAASLNLVSKGASTNLNKLVIQLDDTKVTGNAIMRGSATAFKLNVD
ncbi:MAG: AsmA family protein [Gammaproteobacteria bacterium]|nr:AsmA family protein [Gammaproteobacteria bacterium]